MAAVQADLVAVLVAVLVGLVALDLAAVSLDQLLHVAAVVEAVLTDVEVEALELAVLVVGEQTQMEQRTLVVVLVEELLVAAPRGLVVQAL